jgi:hypothetical protein
MADRFLLHDLRTAWGGRTSLSLRNPMRLRKFNARFHARSNARRRESFLPGAAGVGILQGEIE